jgi:hypothetical protein
MQSLDSAAMVTYSRILDGQPLTPAKITFAWTIAAGPALSRAAVVSRAEDGVIRVRPTSAAWQHEIIRALPILRTRMAHLLGPGVVEKLDVVRLPDDGAKARGRRRRQ